MAKKAASQKKVATPKKAEFAVFDTSADAKTALLVVSLLVNAFVISLWVAMVATSQYDVALSQFFLGR